MGLIIIFINKFKIIKNDFNYFIKKKKKSKNILNNTPFFIIFITYYVV
jgi:hypothetical protein